MDDSRVCSLFEQYLKIEKQSSPNTIESYMRDIKMFRELIGVNYIDVTQDDIINYVAYIKDNYANSSLNRKIAALRTFYKYLVSESVMNSNPTSEIKLRAKTKRLPKYLSVDEINLFLDSLSDSGKLASRNKAMFETLYATGLRVSELLNIKISDVYLDESEIKVYGKGSKERIVILNENACAALSLYIYQSRVNLLNEPTDYLFLNTRGGSLSRQGFYKILKEQCALVGIFDVSPHKFRHSIATHMIQSGADLRMVQELLGHTDISITQVYTHLNNSEVQNEYNKIHIFGKENNE